LCGWRDPDFIRPPSHFVGAGSSPARIQSTNRQSQIDNSFCADGGTPTSFDLRLISSGRARHRHAFNQQIVNHKSTIPSVRMEGPRLHSTYVSFRRGGLATGTHSINKSSITNRQFLLCGWRDPDFIRPTSHFVGAGSLPTRIQSTNRQSQIDNSFCADGETPTSFDLRLISSGRARYRHAFNQQVVNHKSTIPSVRMEGPRLHSTSVSFRRGGLVTGTHSINKSSITNRQFLLCGWRDPDFIRPPSHFVGAGSLPARIQSTNRQSQIDNSFCADGGTPTSFDLRLISPGRARYRHAFNQQIVNHKSTIPSVRMEGPRLHSTSVSFRRGGLVTGTHSINKSSITNRQFLLCGWRDPDFIR